MDTLQHGGRIWNPQLILCDLPTAAQASGKKCSLFNKPLKSPASFGEVEALEALTGGLAPLAIASPPPSAAQLACA